MNLQELQAASYVVAIVSCIGGLITFLWIASRHAAKIETLMGALSRDLGDLKKSLQDLAKEVNHLGQRVAKIEGRNGALGGEE